MVDRCLLLAGNGLTACPRLQGGGPVLGPRAVAGTERRGRREAAEGAGGSDALGVSAVAVVKYVARPKEGDVAYVSGAAGATGLIACHTLKHLGCRVIGSAGTPEKALGDPGGRVRRVMRVNRYAQVEMLKKHGFEAFNYKDAAGRSERWL
eukprot:Skav201945  [mRNA]  locus=scaffold2764:92562:94826:- [translate_table: standard]